MEDTLIDRGFMEVDGGMDSIRGIIWSLTFKRGKEGLKTLHLFKAVSPELTLMRCTTTRYRKTGMVNNDGVRGGKVGGARRQCSPTWINTNGIK